VENDRESREDSSELALQLFSSSALQRFLQFCCAKTACGNGQGGLWFGLQAKLFGSFDVVSVSSV
jgi:hypothetical protein